MNQQAFGTIEALDLEPIKVKLMHEESGEGWSRAHADAVEKEYRRFLILMKKYPQEQAAPLMDVDTFWHYHILDTLKYAADCDAVFGHFLHHFPYIGLRGEADKAAHHRLGVRMKELYEETFGEDYGQAASAWSASPERAAAAGGQAAWSARAAGTAGTAAMAWSARASVPGVAWSARAPEAAADPALAVAWSARAPQAQAVAWSARAPEGRAVAWSARAPEAQAAAWSARAPEGQAVAWSARAPEGQAVAWSARAPEGQAVAWSARAPEAQAVAWSARAPEGQAVASSARAPGGQAVAWSARAPEAQAAPAPVAVDNLYIERPRLTPAA
ncbi:uncharacterized protein DUF1399 [Pseudoduganella lurida]|uniref:Uncharacterized protein DUF1399 n=1 Tax=Pseudoduganella lurida TaxID=1036180 RepID=A0A562R8Y9_9BURK|nr:glycine-rich domain-containing protein-like [Pseudoduganella lurida]TWI65353.1 uncharacterized protein DUF1399 [Pseudoduganella lurida]